MSEGTAGWAEDHSDQFHLTLRWAVEDYHLDFKVRCGCRQPDGSILYLNDGCQLASGFDDAERFVDGCIKWDGCSHLYFGDDDGYLHLCGGLAFRGLEWALRKVWAEAETRMPKFDRSCAGVYSGQP